MTHPSHPPWFTPFDIRRRVGLHKFWSSSLRCSFQIPIPHSLRTTHTLLSALRVFIDGSWAAYTGDTDSVTLRKVAWRQVSHYDEQWTGRVWEGAVAAYFKVHCWYLREETQVISEYFRQHHWCPGRGSNRPLPEEKTETLKLLPIC
jgi:hypothetical protein